MMRRFAQDALLYSLPTFLAKAVGIILLPIYARHLGPRDLGFIEFAAAVSVFALLLIPLEINQAMARLLPESDDRGRHKSIIYSTLAFTAWAFLIASILIYLGRYQIFAAAGIPESYVRYTPLVLIHLATLAWVSVLQVQFRFLQQVGAAAGMNIAVIALNFATILYFALNGLEIGEYFLSQIISNGVGALLATIVLIRRFGAPLILPSRAVTREMLAYSAPIVVSSFGVALSLGLDRILVARYAGLAELGFYGVAAKFGSIVAIGFTVASSAMTPVVFRSHMEEATRRLIERLFHYTMAGVIALMIGATLFSPLLVKLLAGAQFAPSAKFVFFIVLSSTLSNLYIFFMGMDIAKQTRLISKINIGMGVASAILSFALIPFLGVWGAVISAVVAAALRLGLYMYFSQKLYRLNVSPLVPFMLIAALTVWNLIYLTGWR